MTTETIQPPTVYELLRFDHDVSDWFAITLTMMEIWQDLANPFRQILVDEKTEIVMLSRRLIDALTADDRMAVHQQLVALRNSYKNRSRTI